MSPQYPLLHWHPQPAHRLWRVSPHAQGWLRDQGSLTQRLIAVCEGRFSVQVQFQGWRVAELDERQGLDLPARQRSLIREVRLCCDEQILVYARTIIPAASLSGAERKLGRLGNRPLGAYLFSNPWMRRQRMEFAVIQPHHRQYPPMPEAIGHLYGRRSLFCLHQRPLLVCEWFSPEILQMACP